MFGMKSVGNRKFSFSKRCTIAAIFMCVLFSAPLLAEGDFLFSAYPHFTLPLGNEKHNINYGIGGGLKLSYRPFRFFEFGLYGDYFNYSVQNVSPISVFDVGLTAGYVLPIGNRFSLNLDMNVGMYKAVRNTSMTGLDAGVSLSFAYKARPSLYFGASTMFTHFAAGQTALVNGLSFYPKITFNLTEAFGGKPKLRIDTKEILPVFPVLYSWYEDNRFATVDITNEENVAIESIKVFFFQPQYMGQANICYDSADTKLKLEPGKTLSVDLTAFFNERMLEMTEKSDTQAFVTVEYSCLGKKKSREFPIVIPVYGRNSMSWADDRRAAVFVSSKDPAAMYYSKNVSSIVRENMRIGVPANIQYAMGIFDSLAGFGMNYVIDPSSAYTDNVGTETPDFLQFPYQTLSYRGGDCDDLSILVCSLFEAVGIDTAFITIPGHIYMAFNSGLSLRQAQEQFGALDNFIVLENEVWVPLEITLTDEGFNKAWRVGIREWRVAEREGTAALYKMSDSWKIYKPVSVPGAAVTFSMPEKKEIASAFEKSVDAWILREIGQKVEAYKNYIARTGDMGAQNDLGALYGRYGLFDLASAQLRTPAKNGNVAAMLNTANVQYAKKEFSKAKKSYKNVLKHDANNALAYLGVARCCYELEDYNECDLAYQKVRALDKDLADTYAYLGAFESTVGRAFNLADRLAYTVWPSEGSSGYKDELDAMVAQKNSELQNLYGDAAKETIEKANAASTLAKERDDLTSFSADQLSSNDVYAQTVSHEYVGLPSQISILTPEGLLSLVQPAAPEEEIVEPQKQVEEIPVVAQIPIPAPQLDEQEKAAVVQPMPVEPLPENAPLKKNSLQIPSPQKAPQTVSLMKPTPELTYPKTAEPPAPKPAAPKKAAPKTSAQKPAAKPAEPKPQLVKLEELPPEKPWSQRIKPEDLPPEEKPVVAKKPKAEPKTPAPKPAAKPAEPKPQLVKLEELPPEKPLSQRIKPEDLPAEEKPVVAKKPKAEPKKAAPKTVAQKPAEKPLPVKPTEKAAPAKPAEKPQASKPQQVAAKEIVKAPYLSKRGYYIQLGVFKNLENFEYIYNKYSKEYPLVYFEQGELKYLLVGPLSVDEYGTVLERFKNYGFTQAFVKCIM